jgi:ABC-type glutathione transport system ATPase component
VALVGESGSGKSVASLAIMGLPAGTMVTGRVRLNGADVLTQPARERRAGVVAGSPWSSRSR